MVIEKIRKTIDSANISFLLGAGVSRPFLEVLNDIEIFLTDKTKTADEILAKKKEYFSKVMAGNINVVDGVADANKDKVLADYKNFFKSLNKIVLKRETSILTKQVNVFTTNIDVFPESALEETGIEFNDGFHGRFNPTFNLGNFKKSCFKKSLHYENTSEIPVFNILKLHGSLTWRYGKDGDNVVFDRDLSLTRDVSANLATPQFEKTYRKLLIVNPTKDKFGDTLLNQYYYDLLRIFSNELEKENSVLFVAGFSFADEHIRDLTVRVAASNPTLKIYIFAHTTTSAIYDGLRNGAKNKNIEVLIPPAGSQYDLPTITSTIFDKIIYSDDSISEDVDTEVDEAE